MVELCKRAEIGVGADIAFNNQEENGNWADLEKKINKKDNEIHWLNHISKVIIKE